MEIPRRSSLLLALALLLQPPPTLEYSMGAPDSACARMEPGHGFSPQPHSASPFTVAVDGTTVAPGGEVRH